MPKRFLFFSKGQRIAIVVLLTLIVVVIVADATLSRWAPKPKSFFDEAFSEETLLFETITNATHDTTTNTEKRREIHRSSKTAKQEVRLFPFDPNTLDSAGFVLLGIKPHIASNILKYRKKGGHFKVPADLGKIYGIDSALFATLQPFVQIAQTTAIATPDILLEINTADTTQLTQIMSKGLAKRIVIYREKLGGYYSTEQLKEVYRITEKELKGIEPYLCIEGSHISTIDVNSASIERLKRHPYINFYQAKAICELRKAKKKIVAINELALLEEFSDIDIKRLTPYLNFNE